LNKTHHNIKELDLPRAKLSSMLLDSIEQLETSAQLAYEEYDLKVAAGHGLNYQNVKYIAEIDEIIELNIGQSIIARSVFSGLEDAIIQMKNIIDE
jgi:pyridoxine 5-phosphate synthase